MGLHLILTHNQKPIILLFIIQLIFCSFSSLTITRAQQSLSSKPLLVDTLFASHNVSYANPHILVTDPWGFHHEGIIAGGDRTTEGFGSGEGFSRRQQKKKKLNVTAISICYYKKRIKNISFFFFSWMENGIVRKQLSEENGRRKLEDLFLHGCRLPIPSVSPSRYPWGCFCVLSFF